MAGQVSGLTGGAANGRPARTPQRKEIQEAMATITEPKTSPDEVLKRVDEDGIEFIRFWFTDINGQLKSFAVGKEELEGALEDGMGFDGSSITGFNRIEESDMIAMPDPDTYAVLPWRDDGGQGKGNVARLFCDVLVPGGEPYVGDPRFVMRRALARAADMGFDTFNIGPELGIPVEYTHHEVGPSQHEIDMRYAEGLRMSDNAMTYRIVVKEIAQLHGVYATFMPKPLFGENGSGMHTHQSLFAEGKNAFFDADDEWHLSEVGKAFIAGQLHHAREISAVFAQWVNSYKRLVPGYEAPVYVAWSRRNRSALIRIPLYKPGNE